MKTHKQRHFGVAKTHLAYAKLPDDRCNLADVADIRSILDFNTRNHSETTTRGFMPY